MDWVKVTVFADETAESVARIRTVLALTEAKLDVIAPGAAPALPFGYDPAGVMLDDFQRSAGETLGSLRARVRSIEEQTQADKARLALSPLFVEPGLAARAAAAVARASDAVVVGQPKVRQSGFDAAILKGVLMASGRPCLILPYWPEPRALDGRALIAWRGTPEAARAVRDALPLLKRFKEVRVFCASGGEEVDGEGPQSLARLAEWLTLHGVRVENTALTPPIDEMTATVGKTILDEASAFGADLLVMGGFGHARLREMVFGGATQHLLHQANCAVMLSH